MRRTVTLVTGLALLALAARLPQDPAPRSLVRAGDLAFEWVDGWLRLPEGMQLGNTHGCTVVDAQGRVYFNTDAEHAVVVCSPEGEVVDRWGKELAGGLHGMAIVREGDEEFLYLTHLGKHAAYKATLDGKILWTLPWPESSGRYESEGQYNPTGIAVAPDGSIYIADGYGRNWVHQFDAERNYVRSFGGHGSEPGQFKTCHGIWLDTRGAEPTLMVSDRENHRLQRFGLDGTHLAVIEADLRRPCNVYEHAGRLVVADLAGRISLLDADDALIGHLCDNPDEAKRAQNGVPPEQWAVGEFLSPHSAAWSADGDLYVMDWNSKGRMTKLRALHD